MLKSVPSTNTAAVSNGSAAASNSAEASLETRLKALVSQKQVMLFMKGSPAEPRCGFSRKVGVRE